MAGIDANSIRCLDFLRRNRPADRTSTCFTGRWACERRQSLAHRRALPPGHWGEPVSDGIRRRPCDQATAAAAGGRGGWAGVAVTAGGSGGRTHIFNCALGDPWLQPQGDQRTAVGLISCCAFAWILVRASAFSSAICPPRAHGRARRDAATMISGTLLYDL